MSEPIRTRPTGNRSRSMSVPEPMPNYLRPAPCRRPRPSRRRVHWREQLECSVKPTGADQSSPPSGSPAESPPGRTR